MRGAAAGAACHGERGRRLHGHAAAWYQQRGLPDDAVRHALAAGEPEWAARLVEEHFDSVFNLRGEQATIQSWLPALPAEVVRPPFVPDRARG